MHVFQNGRALNRQVEMVDREFGRHIGVLELCVRHKRLVAVVGEDFSQYEFSHRSLCFENRFVINRPKRLITSTIIVNTTAAA